MNAMTSMMRRVLIFGILSLLSHTAVGAQTHYQCSYYLFEIPATVDGCSDCYVPLVVTQAPIEAQRDQEVAVITTYERDSIWQVQRQVLKYSALAIEPPARRIKFAGKIYRYQLVGNAEPVRLLKNPSGTIPVHRISHPRKGDDGLWEILLRDLSTTSGAEPCVAGDARWNRAPPQPAARLKNPKIAALLGLDWPGHGEAPMIWVSSMERFVPFYQG